jgi:HAD superfamily hydrolase (TIGR01459 family)
MIWQSLFNKDYSETNNLGKNCFHIYNKKKIGGRDILKGLEFNFVEDIDHSNFILGCSPFENTEVLDYVPLLDKSLKKDIIFLCANPDFQTIEASNNENHIFCMGTISELYKNMGGKVFFLGKPNIDIYRESCKKIAKLNKSKILAIGDSLHHDIKGATNYGIDSLLITATGIHSKIFHNKNLNLDSNANPLLNIDIKPTFICSEFTF